MVGCWSVVSSHEPDPDIQIEFTQIRITKKIEFIQIEFTKKISRRVVVSFFGKHPPTGAAKPGIRHNRLHRNN